MIEKIDTNKIRESTKERVGGDCYRSLKPNPYEKACIDKINEIVDRFNEVFPI